MNDDWAQKINAAFDQAHASVRDFGKAMLRTGMVGQWNRRMRRSICLGDYRAFRWHEENSFRRWAKRQK